VLSSVIVAIIVDNMMMMTIMRLPSSSLSSLSSLSSSLRLTVDSVWSIRLAWCAGRRSLWSPYGSWPTWRWRRTCLATRSSQASRCWCRAHPPHPWTGDEDRASAGESRSPAWNPRHKWQAPVSSRREFASALFCTALHCTWKLMACIKRVSHLETACQLHIWSSRSSS